MLRLSYRFSELEQAQEYVDYAASIQSMPRVRAFEKRSMLLFYRARKPESPLVCCKPQRRAHAVRARTCHHGARLLLNARGVLRKELTLCDECSRRVFQCLGAKRTNKESERE